MLLFYQVIICYFKNKYNFKIRIKCKFKNYLYLHFQVNGKKIYLILKKNFQNKILVLFILLREIYVTIH